MSQTRSSTWRSGWSLAAGRTEFGEAGQHLDSARSGLAGRCSPGPQSNYRSAQKQTSKLAKLNKLKLTQTNLNKSTQALPCYRQACFEAYRVHLECMRPEECFTPKHHLMIHLLHRSGYFGNPRFYANWLDENLNKTLKSACRLTSQATFENSVLTRKQSILSSSSRKRARPS